VSAERVRPAPLAVRVGQWLSTRQGLSWLISLLAHGRAIMLVLFFCIVIIRSNPPTQNFSVRRALGKKVIGGSTPSSPNSSWT